MTTVIIETGEERLQEGDDITIGTWFTGTIGNYTGTFLKSFECIISIDHEGIIWTGSPHLPCAEHYKPFTNVTISLS